MWLRLQVAAQPLGIKLAKRTHTFNSRAAAELAKWAEIRGRGWPFHLAVYQAYFLRGENIANKEVLQGIASDVGLDQYEASEVLRQQVHARDVDEDWGRCRRQGVTAVPTLMAQGERLVGLHSPDELQDFICRVCP